MRRGTLRLILPVTGLFLTSGMQIPLEDCNASVRLLQTHKSRKGTQGRLAKAPPLDTTATSLILLAGIEPPQLPERNGSLIQTLEDDLEYELNMQATDWPVKNKLLLAAIEMLSFGACGIDRCYMGQPCLGVAKGLTLGGFVIWALLDSVSVILTCLSKSPYISAMGMHAKFEEGTVAPAFVFVLLILILQWVVFPCATMYRRLQVEADAKRATDDGDPDESAPA